VALKDIRGQENAVSIIKGIMARDRIAGSYLFTGESGIGKRTAALNFAKALNCLDISGQGSGMDSCDSCSSCRKIDAGTHPDLLVIDPEDRQIKIEEIRAVEEALAFRPFEGRKKIVLIDDADTMNQAAANAFLKTLEEPPEGSLIILVSSRPDRMPSTVLSRCSRIPFRTLSLDACREVLHGKISDEDADKAARLSLGRPGLALSSDLKEDRDWFVNLLGAMLKADKDNWASRPEAEKWLDIAMAYFRDLAVLRISGRASALINADIQKEMAKTGKSVELQGIIAICKELSSLKGLLQFNLNKSLVWNYTASMLRKGLLS